MTWLKTIWQFLFKKDIVKQDKLNPAVVSAFAKKLSDYIKFDKVFNGKIAFMDKYDHWAIIQVINVFVSLLGSSVKETFWKSVEQFMIYYTDGNHDRAAYIMSHEINPRIKAVIARDVQDLIVYRNISLIFEVSMIYLERGDSEYA
jgi:hypothetical protein